MTTSPSDIPEAAVEAATQAIIDAAYGQELPEAPEDLARAALEAAAPHMLAGAWDAGEEAGSDNQCAWDGWRHSKGYPITNPYRPTP